MPQGEPVPGTVNVRIPTHLRALTGGAGTVDVDGPNVRAVLDQLESAYPGLRPRILDDSGALRRFVNVYVGDEDIRFGAGLDTDTPPGSQVSILTAVAGG
jgi:molybdopterin converting factor small subunit